MVAGAAAWVGKRRYLARAMPTWGQNAATVASPERESEQDFEGRGSDFDGPVSEDLIEVEVPELPIGRSADPAIDDALQPLGQGQNETSGAALLARPERRMALSDSLDEIWDASPGFAEGEQTEGYDAVAPDNLGAVWLSRATQTTHDAPPHASYRADLPDLEDLVANEAQELDEDADDDAISDDDLSEGDPLEDELLDDEEKAGRDAERR